MTTDTDIIKVLADDEETDASLVPEDARRRVITIDNRDSGDTIRLHVPVTAAVSAIIDAIYGEFRLARQADDRLTCRRDGEDVFQFAQETLHQYLEQGHCPQLHWSFAGDTGGA